MSGFTANLPIIFGKDMIGCSAIAITKNLGHKPRKWVRKKPWREEIDRYRFAFRNRYVRKGVVVEMS